MIRILRLIKGYVEFCAEGGFPERFINLCKIHGISLWNVKNDGVKVYACTTEADFKRISLPTENSGMKIEIIKTKGLKSFVKRHKWRCGAALGIAMTFVFWIFMSGFVWEVEVLEAKGVNAEAFTESLADLGVKVGARKSKIDIIDVQNQLMNEYKELLWVSVNIFGGKVQVEMSEFVEQQEITDTKTPMNLVASKKGRVVLVKGYNGVNAVKEGDNVTEGTLLISGVGLNSDGSEYFVHADGEVFAETENYHKFICERKKNISTSYEKNGRYFLYVFSLKIPLGIKTEGDFLTESRIFLKSRETVLPFGLIREDNFRVKEKTAEYTGEEAELQALFDAVALKREQYNSCDLEKVEYSVKNGENNAVVVCRIVCTENIATESPILTE